MASRGGRPGAGRGRPYWQDDANDRCPYEKEPDQEEIIAQTKSFPYYPKIQFPDGAFDRLTKETKVRKKSTKPSLEDTFDVESIELDLLKSLKNNHTYLLY